MRTLILCLTVLIFVSSSPIAFSKDVQHLTDDQIKQILIDRSVQEYPGNCPCPYNVDRAGRRCGRRSAWSRPGGYSPLCYPSDVTNKMVKQYRKTHPGVALD